MLKLTRRTGERIRITTPDGEFIDVLLIQMTSEHSCRLGVKAPADYHIDRITRSGEVEIKEKR